MGRSGCRNNNKYKYQVIYTWGGEGGGLGPEVHTHFMSFKHIFQVKVKQHFLHEKCREQTLRRETWSTLLQITLRVSFMSKKHWNPKNKH